MDIEHFSCVLAVRESSKLPVETTIQDFFYSDNHYPIYFDPDGCYYETYGKITGAYRFCTANELNEIAQAFGWPLTSDCPFVESIIGYCLLQPWEYDAFYHIVKTTLNLGCGFFARMNDGIYFDIVAEKELTLKEIVGRHGFGEGALALMETSDYDMYIRNAIAAALEHLCLKPNSYHSGDHNHILSGFEGDDKNRIANWNLFNLNADKITVTLWIADWRGFQKIKKSLLIDPQH